MDLRWAQTVPMEEIVARFDRGTFGTRGTDGAGARAHVRHMPGAVFSKKMEKLPGFRPFHGISMVC